jgi:cytoskeletal protein CcmA (bactofilin family)
MFSKKSETETPQARPQGKPMASNSSTFSVLGTDVSIKGDVNASADLHIDGRVEGDITCASIVQGESSQVSGSITAESARLAGHVVGSINARELVILKTARIEGDVHYEALTIEQGAKVEGRFAPRGKASSAPAAELTKTEKPVSKSEEDMRLSLAG